MRKTLFIFAAAVGLWACEKETAPAPVLDGVYMLQTVTQGTATLKPPTVAGTATLSKYNGETATLAVSVTVNGSPVSFAGTVYPVAAGLAFDLYAETNQRTRVGTQNGNTLNITATSGNTTSQLVFSR